MGINNNILYRTNFYLDLALKHVNVSLMEEKNSITIALKSLRKWVELGR